MAVSKDPQNTSASKPLSAVARLAVVGVVGGAIMAAMAVPVVAAFGKASEVAGEQIGALPAELATPPLPNRTYMLDADGNRIATLFEENRVSVPLSQISENMQRAIIAVEDERFYEHKGVDVQGLIRAQLENTASGSIQQGASTLTMQYVRNVLVTAAADEEQVEAAVEQTTARKLQEIRYAVQVERELTKDEILNRYLNIAYFGSGAYGVEAASRRYFGHSAKKLTTAEAATLAGIVQSPVGYDPLVNPEDSETRRNAVLTKMESLDYITPEQYQKAVGKPIGSYLNPKKISNGCAESKYPFYCDYAVKQILNDPNYGKTTQDREDFLKRGGLVIRTAMQPKAQAAATNAVMNTIPPKDPSKKGAAIAMVNPPTGEVVALAQNRLWGTKGKGKTTYNYAVDQKDGGTTGMQALDFLKRRLWADEGRTLAIVMGRMRADIACDGSDPWAATCAREIIDRFAALAAEMLALRTDPRRGEYAAEPFLRAGWLCVSAWMAMRLCRQPDPSDRDLGAFRLGGLHEAFEAAAAGCRREPAALDRHFDALF